MARATPAPWRQSLTIIATLLVLGAAPAAGEDAADVQRPPELQQRLDAAMAAKGADYRPRTEHLRPDGRPRFTNRLILEDSPYLLQHAHNPVDWHAWGAEAFAQARREGKLVFLSIGYSTCHWCHVMERESFEDLEIARLLNRDFVAIKVDREVRPDLDQVYMTAVELLTGQGGWPMSSILTPQGETIIAGTYFPPDRFTRLLERARAGWRERPDALRAQARIIAAAVERALATGRQAAELDSQIPARGASALIAQHDDLQGGFGSAPKFPHEPRLALLLDRARRDADAESLKAAVVTLSAMARGGIHDQVGGGFHRYAIDNDWLVPHFEKMLYNQAQLARLYIQAAALTGDPELERAGRRTLDFVLRDLSSPQGVFYSATDADSADSENRDGEGRFFLWTPDDLRAALGAKDADLAMRFYGVSEAGNFEGRSILYLPRDPETFARSEGISTRELWERIDVIAAALYRARERRPHPHRDEKILTGWNGLMIAALAEAGAALNAPRYLRAAQGAADLLWGRVRPAPGALQRVYLAGRASTPAQQEDYALLGAGMLALYDATGDGRWLARAQELADALWSRFTDSEGGGLFMAEADAATPAMARAKDLSDGALPSGTSASLDLLASLSRRSDEPRNGERAQALVASVSAQVREQPEAFPSLLVALTRLREGEAGPLRYAARGALRVQAHVLSEGPGALQLAVDIGISPGWHINAARPSQDYLVPTRLSLSEEAQGWVLGATDYPAPEIIKLGFRSEPLPVYQGRVSIQAPLGRVSLAETAPRVVPARLRLQACNDTQCLPPETLVLRVPVATQ